jgi:hypothetical protein
MAEETIEEKQKPRHKMTQAEIWLARKKPKADSFFKSTTGYNKHISRRSKKTK